MATTSVGIDKETGLSLCRTMQVIRQCEERLAKSHQQGLVHGACHTYVGEEAIATGVFAHLRLEDVVLVRIEVTDTLWLKGHPQELIAELYGREDGCSGGRGWQYALVQARNWNDGNQWDCWPMYSSCIRWGVHL